MISKQLADKFWELYRGLNDYTKAWGELYRWSLNEGVSRGLSSPVDSWKSGSGGAFEEISQDMIRNQVSESHLSSVVRIARWHETEREIREGILAELVWPKGQLKQPEFAESKVDVVAILQQNSEPTRVISVYSCKSSVAERYQQDLFWAEKLKGRGIKFCFVTIDGGFVKYATRPEKPRRSSKTLILAQALYDRIYLLTEEDIVQGRAVFRRIDEIVKDLDLWWKAY